MRVINKKTTWYEGPHRFFIRAIHRRCEKSNVYHFFENQLKAPSPPHPTCLHWTWSKYLALACGLYISCRPDVHTGWHQQCIHTISSTLLIFLTAQFVYKVVCIWHTYVLYQEWAILLDSGGIFKKWLSQKVITISEYLGVLKWWRNMQFSSKLVFGPYQSLILKEGAENKVKTKCVLGRDRKWNIRKNDYESFNSISSGTRKEL